jgi:FF domain/WW domain
MLKSTHKAVSQANPQETTLPEGWTEHKAPTGHSYFYNAETKQSTYTRPTAPCASLFFIDHTATASASGHDQTQSPYGPRPSHGLDFGGSFRGGLSYQDRSRRQQQQDRPKRKRAIPGCEPWILVTTKLGRRFVYNPEKNESFWKFPQDVLLATFEMDRKEQEGKERLKERSLTEVATAEPRPEPTLVQQNGGRDQREADDSESYEEVEVTDDEVAEADHTDSDGPSKKQRTDLAHQEPPGPFEFNEEDITYQLAQMGQDYGLDPGEYGDGDEEDLDTGLPLSIEDSQALFYDLLSDHAINPYTTWEKIIEEGRIIDDERYVALPNMRARKEAFTTWSTERIQELKEKRAKEERKDPKIPYMRFLHEHATPKLYWPEFRRKYRKEDAMKDAHVSDKEREKLYRDHIARLKLPESTRKSDLKDLLKGIPLQHLHRNSTLDNLPATILIDLRFISLTSRTREPLVEAYISTLPFPSSDTNALHPSVSDQAEAGRKAAEREKREKALRERERMVQEEKRKFMGALKHGKEMMREEEREIEEALRNTGREGLRSYMREEEEVVDVGNGKED